MDAPTVDLPEQLILIAIPEEGKEGKLQFIKPRSPEGKDTAVAFTKKEMAENFVRKAGIESLKPSLVELDAGEVLEGLLTSGEPDLCLNPMDESETYLRYDLPSTIERREAPPEDSVEVRKAKEALDTELITSLKNVAAQMPVIEKIWHLEIFDEASEIPTRTLLAVKLMDGATQDDHDQTFMILGVDWCETLPRGMAVDMMPLEATPKEAGVADLDPIYVKAL